MDTNAHWIKWGKIDPYFGVVSSPQFHLKNLEGNRAEFFAMGERDSTTVMSNISNFYNGKPHRRILDFGCGVGRLLLPFSRQFEEAVGVDVSPGMIEEAKKNAVQQHCNNVYFVQADDYLSGVTGTFDLVHSQHVLQHIPVERGLAVADRLMGLVSPDGYLMLHFSIQTDFTPLRKFIYAIKHRVPFGLNLLNLVQGRSWGHPSMQSNSYPVHQIIALMVKNGFSNIRIVPNFVPETHAIFICMYFYGIKNNTPK